MPSTKAKAEKKTTAKGASPPRSAAPAETSPGEVLTLAEAAAYLRVPEDEVQRLATAQELPGRRIGTAWRFLKSALQDWLRLPSPPPKAEDGLQAWAGAFQDDPDLPVIVQEAYRQRGRPLTGEER